MNCFFNAIGWSLEGETASISLIYLYSHPSRILSSVINSLDGGFCGVVIPGMVM